ncbi:unnamed protein product [Sympodiomycopsis kandeliae]
MLETITNYFQSAPVKPSAELPRQEVETDENGRRIGLEDPDNPALIDDPAIFASVPSPSSNYPAPEGAPLKTLVPSAGKPFVDPRVYGGRGLDQSAGDLGEPLNVIISALSSPEILTRKGLQSYFRSLDFDFECLGLHAGTPQQAWLDPRGWQDQVFLFRQVYTPLDHLFGTCIESLMGGNHIRAWQQQGTGAWFLALSHEQNVTQHHDIVPNGYDRGRDEMVAQFQKEKNNQTSFFGKKYTSRVEYISGLTVTGSQGVNHGIAIDGRTALITVTLLNPSKSDKKLATKASAEAEAIASKDSEVENLTKVPLQQVPIGGATRQKPKEEKKVHRLKQKIVKRLSLAS